jgi:hypothetical protein
MSIHDGYVKELADAFERQGYKIIIEGKIPKYKGKEWGEPDLFVLRREGSHLSLRKIVEVTVGDKKEGLSTKTTTTLESKVKKIREYYDPPELIVFEPTGYTNNHYDVKSETKGRFTDYDKYNAYLQEKWKKEGLNVVFWNEWDLEKLKEQST